MSGGESKVSEALPDNPQPAVENTRQPLRPLCTAGDGWEKDLRVSTPVLRTTNLGLGLKGHETPNFQQLEIPAHEAQKIASAPAAKQMPHYEINNAELIEDNNG